MLILASFLLVLIVAGIKSLNQVNFPAKEFRIKETDKVVLEATNFVNGSQIETEVFPTPIVNASNHYNLLHLFNYGTGIPNPENTGCQEMTSPRPHEYFGLCKDNVIAHWYLSPTWEQSYEPVFVKIKHTHIPGIKEEDFLGCKAIHPTLDRLFVMCTHKHGVHKHIV